MEQAVEQEESANTKIAELTQRVVASERLILEKVAAAKAEVFPATSLDHTLDQLVAMRVILPNQRTKIANELRDRPASALTLLEKISESLVCPREGEGVPRNITTESEADPDGWTTFARGGVVQIKN